MKQNSSLLVAALLAALCPPSLAQIDIYQSDAYSAEEVCAREAEQDTTSDYSQAYEQCLEKQEATRRAEQEGATSENTENEASEQAH